MTALKSEICFEKLVVLHHDFSPVISKGAGERALAFKEKIKC
jgi:hypothetical protein